MDRAVVDGHVFCARAMLCSLDLSQMGEPSLGYFVTALKALDVARKELDVEDQPRVVVGVKGGAAEVLECPDWIDVIIQDVDDQDHCVVCGELLDPDIFPGSQQMCDNCYENQLAFEREQNEIHTCRICGIPALPNGDLCGGCLAAEQKRREELSDEIPF